MSGGYVVKDVEVFLEEEEGKGAVVVQLLRVSVAMR